MARWTPKKNDPVKLTECIGRRLFDEPLLSGAPDQKPWRGLDLRHFVESREDRQFSLDRLGETGINNKVVRYLKPRCVDSASKFAEPRRFDGWAFVSVRNLLDGSPKVDWVVEPSPVTGTDVTTEPTQWSDATLEQNLYHAHVRMPTDIDSYDFALQIRQKFVRHGDVLEANENRDAVGQASESQGADRTRSSDGGGEIGG
jgi:hypothetical protein